MLTYAQLRHNAEIKTYIEGADAALAALGYTEHSFAHVTKVSQIASYILTKMNADSHAVELAKIAAYLHDIHDRVNYSVTDANLEISDDKTEITLMLTIDTEYGSVMDYFEIFLGRMVLCRKAAEKLGLRFRLRINGQSLL